jgi:hypothetical protein
MNTLLALRLGRPLRSPVHPSIMREPSVGSTRSQLIIVTFHRLVHLQLAYNVLDTHMAILHPALLNGLCGVARGIVQPLVSPPSSLGSPQPWRKGHRQSSSSAATKYIPHLQMYTSPPLPRMRPTNLSPPLPHATHESITPRRPAIPLVNCNGAGLWESALPSYLAAVSIP